MSDISGFVAGTLVHTDQGLVPIEEIKVGDMVLSKPESKEGDLAYQPVAQTFVSDDKEIWGLFYWSYNVETGFPDANDTRVIFVTGGHPIWVQEYESSNESDVVKVNNWMRPDEIFELGALAIGKVLLDGVVIQMYAKPILITSFADIGYMLSEWDHDPEFIVEFEANKVTAYDVQHIFLGTNPDPDSVYSDTNRILTGYEDLGVVKKFITCLENSTLGGFYDRYKARVYNFTVDNYHTYFIEERGLWVKSSDCY